MSRLVAITGATGFIGGRLLGRLRAEGWQVRALSRTPRPSSTGLQWIRGCLEDVPSLVHLLEGVEAVVHCAGAVRGAGPSDFDPVNVQGVANLVEAALSRPVPPRLLALSSLAAREPRLSAYAASKRRGETVLETAGARLSWTALRPPAVYGPGDRELLPLFRLMARGIAPLLGPREARFSLLYVDDLADALLCWLRLDACPRGIFELHDGRRGGYSWDEVADIAARVRGAPVRRLPVPGWLLWCLGGLGLAWGRLSGRPPMLTPGKVRELRHGDWVCDDGPWRAQTGWAPATDFSRGLRLTLDAARPGA
ncbi:MAG TPA: NAD(P)-dependent oxidoreductase [Gammaproteobacteria bacterium]|nr:NAD(P)-dependent oxidoreductase [Gammaproteobacteria bacterium]